MPQTVGWWLLAAVSVLVVARVCIRLVRRYEANRYRREALRELRGLQKSAEGGASLAALPLLLKRTALGGFPRDEVASLTGAPWLAFLTRTCPGAEFDEELGAALSRVSYRGPEGIPPDTAARLFEATEVWIRGHDARV